MSISCHFWDPQAGAGKLAHSKCEQNASTFVRISHSKRLCPLCPSCLGTFESAKKSMTDDVKKGVPGQGEYTIVSLTDGADEFAKQPPKQ